MRARMVLRYSGIAVEIREIALRNKPRHMLQVSPKGTVPVLVLADGVVIDESLDIMHWALAQRDADGWLMTDNHPLAQQAQKLIAENDGAFKDALDRYKYAIRFPEKPAEVYRAEGEQFLQQLETRLNQQRYLYRDNCTLADVAIFPLIRQFAAVDEAWFEQSPYAALRRWLGALVASELFTGTMQKLPVWAEA